ncbi:unnamed protein product [Amoebophrya sp. A120]|nr:unnamed protein product [Amoebophrya sp. A120]|eukprot:GSA120T00017394001.1
MKAAQTQMIDDFAETPREPRRRPNATTMGRGFGKYGYQSKPTAAVDDLLRRVSAKVAEREQRSDANLMPARNCQEWIQWERDVDELRYDPFFEEDVITRYKGRAAGAGKSDPTAAASRELLPGALQIAEASKDGALQCAILKGVCDDRKAQLRAERLRIYRQKRELLNAGKTAANLRKSVLKMQYTFEKRGVSPPTARYSSSPSLSPGQRWLPRDETGRVRNFKTKAFNIPRPGTAPATRNQLETMYDEARELAREAVETEGQQLLFPREREHEHQRAGAALTASVGVKSSTRENVVPHESGGHVEVQRRTSKRPQTATRRRNRATLVPKLAALPEAAADLSYGIEHRKRIGLLQRGAERLRLERLQAENRILQEQMPDPAYDEEIEYLRGRLMQKENQVHHLNHNLQKIVNATGRDSLRREINLRSQQRRGGSPGIAAVTTPPEKSGFAQYNSSAELSVSKNIASVLVRGSPLAGPHKQEKEVPGVLFSSTSSTSTASLREALREIGIQPRINETASHERSTDIHAQSHKQTKLSYDLNGKAFLPLKYEELLRLRLPKTFDEKSVRTETDTCSVAVSVQGPLSSIDQVESTFEEDLHAGGNLQEQSVGVGVFEHAHDHQDQHVLEVELELLSHGEVDRHEQDGVEDPSSRGAVAGQTNSQVEHGRTGSCVETARSEQDYIKNDMQEQGCSPASPSVNLLPGYDDVALSPPTRMGQFAELLFDDGVRGAEAAKRIELEAKQKKISDQMEDAMRIFLLTSKMNHRTLELENSKTGF